MEKHSRHVIDIETRRNLQQLHVFNMRFYARTLPMSLFPSPQAIPNCISQSLLEYPIAYQSLWSITASPRTFYTGLRLTSRVSHWLRSLLPFSSLSPQTSCLLVSCRSCSHWPRCSTRTLDKTIHRQVSPLMLDRHSTCETVHHTCRIIKFDHHFPPCCI